MVHGERGWADLAEAQDGLLSQRTDSVFSTTIGPLSWEQRLWRAVLHAGPDALIGGLTAAEVLGPRNWHRESITVLVTNPLSFDEVEDVSYFRTRRPLTELVVPRSQLPVARIEPAVVLLFAGYERNRSSAHGAIAAAIQQRLSSPDRMVEWVDRLRPLRRAKEFRGLAR